jgi:hypothetical protein
MLGARVNSRSIPGILTEARAVGKSLARRQVFEASNFQI